MTGTFFMAFRGATEIDLGGGSWTALMVHAVEG